MDSCTSRIKQQRPTAAGKVFPARYDWMDAYLQSKNCALKEYKPSWDATLYRLQGKIFALLFEDNLNRPILNLKCDPYIAIEFRESYPHVQRGYHMNKLHWVSLYLDGDTPDEVARDLADISYDLVLHGLSAKLRGQIKAGQCM